ncbi:MAG: NYN domain-containing protein [Lachnospiraceae bacterium]
MESKKYALLIDADNVSAKYISGILEEMTKHGIVTYKRIYGDWTSTQATKWKEELLENAIVPIQQFSNTVGKNATDSALIIDAMDILYANNVDGFCIVSSDSDFTRLANRIRESGMAVIGMGEEKTPKAFRTACTIFTNLENLLDEDETSNDDKAEIQEETVSKATIERFIVSIVTENENKDPGLSAVGSRIVNKYPDFDVRTYGYGSLSKFLEDSDLFRVNKNENVYTVSMVKDQKHQEEVTNYIRSIVEKHGRAGIGISELTNNIRQQYEDFSVKKYGYSQVWKFVQSIDHIEVYADGTKRKRARFTK